MLCRAKSDDAADGGDLYHSPPTKFGKDSWQHRFGVSQSQSIRAPGQKPRPIISAERL